MTAYNPYAAPQAPPPEPPRYGGGPWAGVPQAWSVGDVVGEAWNLFKSCWATVFFAQLLATFVQYLPDVARGAAEGAGLLEEGSSADQAWNLANTVLGVFLTAFLQAGLTRMYLKAARGQAPQMSDVFAGASRFLPMLGMTFLSGLAIFFGVLVFIVPGIILAVGFQLADLFVVDAEMGPIAAMSASWNVSKGHRLALFGFDMLVALALVMGALACGVGVIAAMAIMRIAEVIIYLRITGRAQPAAIPAGPQPMYAGY